MSESTSEPRTLEEDEYRAVFAAAPDGIVLVDEAGRIRNVNPAAVEMFGYDHDEITGETVELLVPEEVRDDHRHHRERYAEEPRPRPMGIGMELRGRRKDGSTFPVEISLSPLEREGETFVIATIRDVSQRQRLRRFGGGTLQAAEEERQRIARELHDDLAQRLASALLRIRLALRPDAGDARTETLDELREEIAEAAESVRRIARGLRPPALEEIGVVAAIRGHVRSVSETTDTRIEVRDETPGGLVDDALRDEGKLAVYRVVQEALGNAVRHSGADRIEVRLGVLDGHFLADVEDDGHGFDRTSVEAGDDGGLGLIGMEERAAIIGGELELDTGPGEGTRVRLKVPLTPDSDDDD